MFAAVGVLCAIAGVAQAKAEERDLAAPTKAGYLYKLTPFVDWPDAAFETTSSPFRLCIAGRDPFGGVIDHAAHGAKVGEHRVVVVRLPVLAKGAACHMLFLAASQTQTPQQMLAIVSGQPVLTVADEVLEAPGAMVQFVTVEGRVRFEIRPAAALAAGLSVSSKLLALAAQPKDNGAKDSGAKDSGPKDNGR